MAKFISVIAILLGVVIYFNSCTTNDNTCNIPNAVSAQVGFSVRHFTDTLAADSIHMDTLMSIADTVLQRPKLISLGEDTTISISGASVSLLGMTLNPDKDSIRYLFQPDTTNQTFDTLQLFYKAYPYFISSGCGFYDYYTISNAKLLSNNFVDSISIYQSSVTNNVTSRNIVIYFKRQ